MCSSSCGQLMLNALCNVNRGKLRRRNVRHVVLAFPAEKVRFPVWKGHPFPPPPPPATVRVPVLATSGFEAKPRSPSRSHHRHLP